MTTIHHLNCGSLQVPPNPKVICHCLLLEEMALVSAMEEGAVSNFVLIPGARMAGWICEPVTSGGPR